MKLALALVLVSVVAGCKVSRGVDGGFAGGGGDIETGGGGGPGPFFDLSTFGDANVNVGNVCSGSTVQNACGSSGVCVACLTLGPSGVCVYPCQLATPTCPIGLTCKAVDADGGSASLVYGGACGGYDGICQ